MTGQQVSDPVEVGAAHAARWKILGFLGVAQLMLILDVTVVAIALPHIQSDLGLSREALTWTVSAYTLTFGCGRRSKTGRFRRSRSERFGQSIEPCSALMLGRVSMPRSRRR